MASKYPLVYIEWLDHSSFDRGTWSKVEDIQRGAGPVKINSVGWIVAEDSDGVTIVSHMDDKGHNSAGDQYIIKHCITKRKKLL